jgi:ribosomal protein S18 acetylase RimI-like enzyme
MARALTAGPQAERIAIRRARVADLPGIGAVFAEAIREGHAFADDRYQFDWRAEREWLKSFGGPRGAVFVAMNPDGIIVGYATVERGAGEKLRHTAEVDTIAVARAYRRCGIGRALMQEAVAWARRHRLKKVWLMVFASNRSALRLYRSLGFVPDGVQRRHVRMGRRFEDLAFMARWL